MNVPVRRLRIAALGGTVICALAAYFAAAPILYLFSGVFFIAGLLVISDQGD